MTFSLVLYLKIFVSSFVVFHEHRCEKTTMNENKKQTSHKIEKLHIKWTNFTQNGPKFHTNCPKLTNWLKCTQIFVLIN